MLKRSSRTKPLGLIPFFSKEILQGLFCRCFSAKTDFLGTLQDEIVAKVRSFLVNDSVSRGFLALIV
jgi:hypothetical protein